MAKMVERDPEAMIRFADQIQDYSDRMRWVCNQLKTNMDVARPFMRDATSQRALQKIEAFADNLIGSLPEAQRAGEKLRESAMHLQIARSVQI